MITSCDAIRKQPNNYIDNASQKFVHTNKTIIIFVLIIYLCLKERSAITNAASFTHTHATTYILLSRFRFSGKQITTLKKIMTI